MKNLKVAPIAFETPMDGLGARHVSMAVKESDAGRSWMRSLRTADTREPKGSSPRRRFALSLSLAIAMASTLTAGALGLSSGAASARCIANQTTVESAAPGGTSVGKEWNINNGTCNWDTEYTGRFCDNASDGKRIQISYNQGGAGAGSAISNGVSCNWLWSFNDDDGYGELRVCITDLGGALIGCGSILTNVSY
jgi:hypothetical protein